MPDMNDIAPDVGARASDQAAPPEVAVIIPARDEGENLPTLIREVEAALGPTAHEIIVVDDGSCDDTATIIGQIRPNHPGLRLLRHNRSSGQSAALRTGVLHARAAIIVTIDGDGQNDPAYIPAMLERLANGGPGLGIVAGQREKRKDGTLKTLASRFANRLRGAILKDGTRDTGCGLKVLPRTLFLRLPFFDGYHRYLPALVLREGRTVAHLTVIDRPRRFGRSKYGIVDRGLRGALDLIGVWWLCRRMRRVEIEYPHD